MTHETIFTMEAAALKYGAGVTAEVGYEMRRLGARRVMLVTDCNLAASDPVRLTIKSLQDQAIEPVLFDAVRVEPTDQSLETAIAFARDGEFDGYVAVGGGSAMDTAKAANLCATYPAALLTYVNPPIGEGLPVPGPLKPLIAIPTTAGTGSETTGVVIFDLLDIHAKTGIAHRALRPAMGLVDPLNTRTLPPMVAACSGLDVLSHALESFTALPYRDREAPQSPGQRPSYQGSNPVSDIWAARAIELVSANIVRAIMNPEDDAAREAMLLAATFAGIGFGNAGVHLPHGMSYPVSGMVRDFVPDDYDVGHPIIPHGMSVILNAPAVFRFTASASPERHLKAARLLGADTDGVTHDDAGDMLANTLIQLMRRTGMPNGLAAVGFMPSDIDDLVAGTLPQHRVTKLSPRSATAEDLQAIFMDAMGYW
jgi:hydroxyacid-oxoacid transhydrogenase